MKTWSFIIVAAGKGTRLGGELKQFRILGGRPVWCWSAIVAEELYKQGLVEELILVVPAGMEEEVGNQAQNFELPVTVITGGPRRSDSVYAGLLASSSWGCLVHDAVRPFVKPGLCRRLMEAVMDGKGAIPVIPVADALKRVLPDGKMTIVPREDLLATQTPQVFPREELLRAFDEHQDGFRDEAEAWIMAGKELVPVRGAKLNFKITDAQDWELASAIVEGGEVMRVGNGFDVHPLVPGRKLRLGGIEIPDAPLGLHGHSDADVVAHAVADALLGAAGESDIGTLFPADD
ncbi:MAG TPA: 2-C-methyl-D-erythritol 2,4-cyclodiphosphate synthase, partial [Thermosynergistes sp.]|nr:2-C-methyl-D-erythritol 2,4-cyclodiphosphate synthase [Thermosynergistes sp.]